MKTFIIAATAYFLGSFCASIPISRRFYGGDVRERGSGNAGATNVARVYGIKAGLLTLVCDMAKTVAAMLLGLRLGGAPGEAIAGVFCIIGHCFPIFFGFHGGKGVSVGAALALMCGIKTFACVMALFLLIAFSGKKVSLASICAAASLPLFAAVFKVTSEMLIMSVFSAVLVIVMHRENIRRLIEGREENFKPRKGR